MPDVAYFVHGRGRGHASRALTIVPELERAGLSVAVFAGGQAAELLGSWPSFRARPVLWPGPTALPRLVVRAARDGLGWRTSPPRLVVSDGDQPALLAARALGIPSIAVGHDLALTACELPPTLPRASRSYVFANAAVQTLVPDRLVAVHFLPTRPRWARVAVARAELAPDLRDPVTREGFVLAYFRDPNAGHVLELAHLLGAELRCYGASAIPGEGARPFARETFRRDLLACSAVIASAGSNLLAECVQLQKPILALHARGDHEQALNTRLADAAGVAQAGVIEDTWRADVARFLDRVHRDDFARVDLEQELPGAPAEVRAAATALLAGGSVPPRHPPS